MEKPSIKAVNQIEPQKIELSVEQFSFSEQEKNIQEVFKLNPELKEIACKSLGIENDIKIQIINQRVDNSNGNIYTSLNVYYKGDKIIDTEHEVKTKSLFKLCSLKDGTTFVSAVLLPEKLRSQGLYSKILQETANEINQKIKNSATVFEDSSENDYSISPSAEKVWNKLGNEIIPNYEAERLYQKYLETIFPESKIKDIVWHGSDKKITQFRKPTAELSLGKPAIYFRKKFIKHKKDSKISNAVIVNSEFPLIVEDFNEYSERRSRIFHDSVYIKNEDEFAVFGPEQIHILGSESDIEKFKEFVFKEKDNKHEGDCFEN